jgi:hypothetical protein
MITYRTNNWRRVRCPTILHDNGRAQQWHVPAPLWEPKFIIFEGGIGWTVLENASEFSGGGEGTESVLSQAEDRFGLYGILQHGAEPLTSSVRMTSPFCGLVWLRFIFSSKGTSFEALGLSGSARPYDLCVSSLVFRENMYQQNMTKTVKPTDTVKYSHIHFEAVWESLLCLKLKKLVLKRVLSTYQHPCTIV